MAELDDRVIREFSKRAELCKQAGENQFRIRAYHNVIGNVQAYLAMGDSLSNHLHELDSIKGFGGKSLEKVRFLMEHEELDNSDLLAKLAEMAATMIEAKEVALEVAPKVVTENGRVPIELAYAAADPVYQRLLGACAGRVSYAGSMRRQKPTVHDVDLVVEDLRGEAPAILDLFASLMETVEAKGTEKCKGYLKGIMMEIRVVDTARFASTMIHCTGSAEFNIAMRAHLKARGWGFSESGLRVDGDLRTWASEESYFDAMGLAWLEPKDREVKNMRWFY